MKQPTLLVFFVLCASSLLAQDQANFTQFYLNPYILNSSYAGIDGKTSASLIYRKQWMNIDGGPAISNFSLHTPVNQRVSGGFSVTNDKRGIISSSTLLFSFGYSIPLQNNAFLRFGLSAGGSWNMVDWNKLEGFNDSKLAQLLDNHASLAGNAGLSFHSKTFHMGIAIPGIFSPSVASEDGFTVSEVKPFQTLIVHASNRFYFADNRHVFEPYAVYRLNSGLPSQYEVAGVLHLNHLVWLGSSFKQDFGISALGGVKLKNSLAIGGSYSLANSGENELNSPTFEVSLNFLLGQRRKNAPVYSFVDTHKQKEKKTGTHPAQTNTAIAKNTTKTTTPVIAKTNPQTKTTPTNTNTQTKTTPTNTNTQTKTTPTNTNTQTKTTPTNTNTQTKTTPTNTNTQTKTNPQQTNTEPKVDEEARKRAEAERLAKHQEEIKRRVEERKNDVVKAPDPAKKDSVVNHNPRFRQEMNVSDQIVEGHHEHEQEQLSRLEEHKENPTEEHNEEGHPHAERHEFVKRGNHAKELDVADYVIGGVFRSEANAKHFSDGLDKLGFDTHFGHLTEKNIWYVYVFKTDDINKAVEYRDKVRKMKMLRDAWLLTVHH